jgi:hypothetical protein
MTTGIPALRIVSCEVISNGSGVFILSWAVSRPASVSVNYIEDGKTERKTLSMSNGQPQGTIRVPGLLPGRSYLYFTEFCDETGTCIREPVKRIRMAEENLARGRPVSGTFTNIIGEDPYFNRSRPVAGRITDGDTSFFDGTAVSGDLTVSDQYCVVDLGTDRTLSRVETVWRRLSFSTNYELSISPDTVRWTVLADRLDGRSGVQGRGDKGDPILTVTTVVPPSEGRYLRLTAVRGSARNKHPRWTGIQLMELRIFE